MWPEIGTTLLFPERDFKKEMFNMDRGENCRRFRIWCRKIEKHDILRRMRGDSTKWTVIFLFFSCFCAVKMKLTLRVSGFVVNTCMCNLCQNERRMVQCAGERTDRSFASVPFFLSFLPGFVLWFMSRVRNPLGTHFFCVFHCLVFVRFLAL